MAQILLKSLLHLYTVITLLNTASAQTSTVGGVAQFSGTPVATNPYGIPTLLYNCAKLPAICQNVNSRNALEDRGGGKLGLLVANDHIELNYDTDEVRKNARRAAVCPSSWKTTHLCPEPNQPNTVPQGSSYGMGSFPAARFNPHGLLVGSPGYNSIADANGGNSGMIWTCDEWPPAMYAIRSNIGGDR